MTENKENWLYSDASGLYFVHDGFIMRATDGKQYDIEEECDLLNELFNKTEQLKKENEELKSEIIEKDKIIANLKDARQSYKQDWKACVSYCDGYIAEIHALKDNIKGLEEENEWLNQENQKLDEKVCSLTMDLITTKSYKQLEKEINRFKKENKQLKNDYATLKLQDKDRYEYCNELKKENDRLKSALGRYGMKLCKEAEEILND